MSKREQRWRKQGWREEPITFSMFVSADACTSCRCDAAAQAFHIRSISCNSGVPFVVSAVDLRRVDGAGD